MGRKRKVNGKRGNFISNEISVIVVAGKYYLIAKNNDNNDEYLHNQHDIYQRFLNKKHYRHEKEINALLKLNGTRDKRLDEIARDYFLPIFSLSHQNGKIPVLQNLGFPSHFPPERMYDDVAFYIRNFLAQTQDVVVSDKSKLEKHGFSSKTSFRNC